MLRIKHKKHENNKPINFNKSIFCIVFAGVGIYYLLNSFATSTSCTATLSSGANISQAVSGVAAGGTVCLNAGTYTWNGSTYANISKNSMTTVQAAPGLSVAQVNVSYMNLALSNNIRFDGLTIGGVALGNDSTPATNIEILNSVLTDMSTVRTPTNTNLNILFQGNSFGAINASANSYEGRLTIRGYNNSNSLGVKIKNNIFGPGGCSDGVQIIGGAYGTEISDNDFTGITEGSCVQHVDAIQLYGSSNTLIKGNYFHSGDSYIMAPDGGDHEMVINNVFIKGGYEPAVQFGSHIGTTFSHNVVKAITVHMSRKSDRTDNSVNAVITNNIFTDAGGLNYIVTGGANGCTNCTNDHNYGVGGTNPITGTIIYAGGINPSTYAGFALATGSAGKGAASDGGDIGINISGDTPTPKTGDLNNDNVVNIFDLSILLSNYGKTTSTGDLNNDTVVNIFDLSILLSNYSK